MPDKPLVSVCCITYKHESFLAQTIESVLMQETDFTVEMVIGEDCSPDGTRAIAQDYARRYPGRVRVLTPAHNLGIMSNLIASIAACTGEFIAFVEGDDYWTDPHKLQLQVDALRANPDCGMCFHDAETFQEPGNTVVWTFSQKFAHILPTAGAPPRRYSQSDVARLLWFMPSASMLFRAASLPRPLPAWVAGVFSGDYTLQLISTAYGPALYLPRLMSRYRLHSNSITNTTAGTMYQAKPRIHEAKMFRQHVLRPESMVYGNLYLANQYAGYADYLGRQGQRLKQLSYLAKVLFYNPQRISNYLKRRLKTG